MPKEEILPSEVGSGKEQRKGEEGEGRKEDCQSSFPSLSLVRMNFFKKKEIKQEVSRNYFTFSFISSIISQLGKS